MLPCPEPLESADKEAVTVASEEEEAALDEEDLWEEMRDKGASSSEELSEEIRARWLVSGEAATELRTDARDDCPSELCIRRSYQR